MRVLVACEFSGRVRDAFIAQGHDALSVDLLPTERPGPHYQGDVLDVIHDGWDLMIAHPPCTYLAKAGARHIYIRGRKENGFNWERRQKLIEAAEFFNTLWHAPIPRIAVENPIMLHAARALIDDPPSQLIHPWEHGHGEQKATYLWLRGLPPANTHPARRRARNQHRENDWWQRPSQESISNLPGHRRRHGNSVGSP